MVRVKRNIAEVYLKLMSRTRLNIGHRDHQTLVFLLSEQQKPLRFPASLDFSRVAQKISGTTGNVRRWKIGEHTVVEICQPCPPQQIAFHQRLRCPKLDSWMFVQIQQLGVFDSPVADGSKTQIVQRRKLRVMATGNLVESF